MKTLMLYWTVATASLSIAQSVNDLPSCSLDCFRAAIATTSCGPTDTACQCTTGKAAIIDAVIPCLSRSSCSVLDLQNIKKVNTAVCAKALSSNSTSTFTGTSPPGSISSTNVSPTQSSTGTIPSSAAPSGPDANVDNYGANTPGTQWRAGRNDKEHANRGPAFEAIAIVMFAVTCSVVLLRIYARLRTQRQRTVVLGLWADDYLALAASVFATGVFGCLVAGVKHGVGKHQSSVAPKDLTTYVFAINAISCIIILKLSVLCLYLRLTPHSDHRRIIWIIFIIIAAHGIAAVLASIFQCTPVQSYWAISGPAFENRKCIDFVKINIFNNAFGAVEDVVIWVLPIPVIAKLNVPASKKTGLYFLVAVSAISVICSFLRLSSMILWFHSYDISWNFSLIPLFTTVEACVALISSSVPAIYPLVRKPKPKTYHHTPAARKTPPSGWPNKDSILESQQGSLSDVAAKPITDADALDSGLEDTPPGRLHIAE